MFTLNKQAELGQWQNNNRTYALNAPISNNKDQAYVITGQRIKRIMKDGTTSVASTQNGTDLHVFPNPASTTLNIPSGWCRMYTLTGDLVLTDNAPYQREIAIANLTTGVYVLHLTLAGKATTTLVHTIR